MTTYEAEKVFKDILLAWRFSKDPPAMEQNVWMKTLKGMEKNIAKTALENCYRDYKHVRYFSLIKFLPTFKEAYKSLAPQVSTSKGWCPCCGGQGFIMLENARKVETAYGCHCRGGARNEAICQNMNCQNPAHLERIKVLAGYHEKYPWQVVGYRKCKFNPVISEVKNLNLPLTEDNLRVLRLLFKWGLSTGRYVQKPTKDVKALAGGDGVLAGEINIADKRGLTRPEI